MALVKDFERKLNELWRCRTVNLRLLVKRRAGRQKSFTRRTREHGIRHLQGLATQILCREGARQELSAITAYRRQRRIKGRGLQARYERMVRWAADHLTGPIIYSFWRGRRCLYVGKGTTWRRLTSYRKSYYLTKATNLKIHGIRSPRQLGKAECLAVHLFEPQDNANRIDNRACPVCSANREIRKELRSLFRLR